MTRKHVCVCQSRDEHCEPHTALQYGGGEPDICEEHGHGWTGDPEAIEEVRAKRDILRAMRGFSPSARARILVGAVTQLQESEVRHD